MQIIEFHLLGGEWAKHMQAGFGTKSPQKVASSKAIMGGWENATFHQRDTGECTSVTQLQVEGKPVFFENLRPRTCGCASSGFIFDNGLRCLHPKHLAKQIQILLGNTGSSFLPLRSPILPQMISQMWAHNQMLPNTKGAVHHQPEPRGKKKRKSEWDPQGLQILEWVIKWVRLKCSEMSRNGK